MLTGLIRKINHVKFLLNDNSTTILTAVGVTGTAVTAYLTGRASFRAAEIIREAENHREEDFKAGGEVLHKVTTSNMLSRWSKVKLVWRCYIPPFGAGLATITSIVFANKISSKRIAALTVASVTSERALKEYKEKVIEKLGIRQEQKIRDEVAQDRVNKHPVQKEVIIAGSGEVLCFDMMTGRYFQSTVEEIKRAENKVNHELVNFMSASLSSFYEELGLPPTPYTDTVGWNMNNRMEVAFSTVMSSDDRPCIAVDFLNPPVADYDRLHD